MDYQYSRIVDPSTYDTEGLCDEIPFRVHIDPIKEDIGAIRAQEDWSKLVSPVRDYKGGLGPKYNLNQATVPECLPERLEIISYATEFAFLHDDITDNVSQKQVDVENDQMAEVFREAAQPGFIESRGSGKERVQSQLLLEMLAIDRERALTSMKAWATFVQEGAGRQHNTRFTTLEEYIPYRAMDAGEMICFGGTTFGMAITIPEHEMSLCRKLTQPAWAAIGLSNDLFSWEKEYAAFRENNLPNVVNAIWILMREHSITVEKAKQLCRVEIKKKITEYLQILEENRNDPALTLDLRKYLDSMQYFIVGNIVWSKDCPRYNAQASYNDSQLSMMDYGVAVRSAEKSGDIAPTVLEVCERESERDRA